MNDLLFSVMSMSGDSCSTSSGCVSDLDNLSEDPSPDSPISSTDSSHSSTNSALNSLPNDINNDIITEIILTTKGVEEVAEDELLEEELIESEIVIDCSLNETSNPVVTENYLQIYNNDRNHCLSEFNSSFDCSSSISSYKSETASIKSDTGSCLESDHKSLNLTKINGCLKEDNCSNSSNSISNSYFCKWTHCDWPGNYDDLVDHIREIHVELQPYQQQKHNWKSETNKNNINNNKNRLINRLNDRKITDNNNNNNNLNNNNYNKKCEAQQYVCLWEGCKVYGKASLSRNWLERHVLEQHSGPRPFKCIVEGCGARFKVQSALERHVNSHFKPNVDFVNNINNCNNSTINCYEPSTSSSSQSMPSNCLSIDSNINNNNNNMNSMNGLSAFELHLQQSSRATMMRCKSIDSTNNQFNNYNNGIINCNTNGTPNKILKRKKSATKLRRKCIIGQYFVCLLIFFSIIIEFVFAFS